jgi:hypothetical protein
MRSQGLAEGSEGLPIVEYYTARKHHLSYDSIAKNHIVAME